MENITQETIEKLISSWSGFKANYNKVNAIIEDLGNCKNDYTRTILFNAAVKILNNMGLGQTMNLTEMLKSVQSQLNDIKTQK